MNNLGSLIIETVEPGTVVHYGPFSETVTDDGTVRFGHTIYLTPKTAARLRAIIPVRRSEELSRMALGPSAGGHR